MTAKTYAVMNGAAPVAAAAAPHALAPILNVGSGHATALRQLAALAATLIGVAPPIEEDTGSARSASVPWQQADLTRIRRTLGWQPRVPLTGSLHDMGLTAGAVPSR